MPLITSLESKEFLQFLAISLLEWKKANKSKCSSFTLLSCFTVRKNPLRPIESTNHPLPVAALFPPLFSVVWKDSHLSGKHPLVLLLFKQVRCVAHVVAVHKMVCVVHADRVHGKPAEEESEDTHRKCTVQSTYWQLTCSICIFACVLWEFSLREYKHRPMVWYLRVD